jgi:hypothetical protein
MTGSYSPLEALTAVFVLFGLFVVGWGFRHAPDGRMAFARPIRAKMYRRRVVQITVYCAIFLVIGMSTAVLATVDGILWPPTVGAAVVAVSACFTVSALSWLIFHQAFGWADFERIVGQKPLVPEDATAVELSLEARPLVHDAINLTAVIIADLSLAQNNGDPWKSYEVIKSVLPKLYRLAVIQTEVSRLIREPSLEIRPPKEGMGGE